MRRIKHFLFAVLCVFLLAIYPIAAQTLPTMPPGGPDNGTFDKSGRYPAGLVNHTSFYSAVAGKNVDMWIYTPPGYSTSQKYGVVFGYQGIGTDAGTIFYDWCVNAGIVCDNLIGEGKISKGVIIVAVDDQFAGNYSNVNDMTIRDAIPYIDSHYSTYADADHRGVYGYSWGGGYAFNVGCKNLDYFHYIGPSAAAPNKDGDNTLFPNGGAYAKQVMKCLFISWGQSDYQSIIDSNVACDNYCNANGIPHYTWVGQDQGHTAGVWRPAMWNFLQLADRAGISGGGGCTPTTITPYMQVSGGAWQQTSSVTVNSGTQVVLGPQPTSGGSWSWSGGGTSGTSREQTISPTTTVTATATYTNSCGATSTQAFTVNVNGSSSGQNVRLTKSNATGFSIDGNNGGANGQQIYLWAGDASNVNQTWVEIDRGGGYYSYQKLNTNYCMDGGNGGANGQSVYLWACDANNQNQQWQKISAGSNFRLQKRNASAYSIDGGNGGANGQNLYLWASDANNQNQQWIFTASSLKSAKAPVADNAASSPAFEIYPNPSDNGNFSISFSGLGSGNLKLCIYNLEGRKVYEQNNLGAGDNTVSSGLAKGIYIIKANGDKYTYTKKLIVK
jgi:enterochelin esterase-like enzyme